MEYNGWLFINKESGITSHDVVAKVRKKLKFKKVGHAGTLDPMATGVVVVALGKATRLIRFLQEIKTYKAEVFLGITTDTLDAEGKVLSQNEVTVSKEEIEKTIKKYIGNIEQIPPMFSAVQQDGKRLYELARKGIEVERKVRHTEIFDIKILSWDLPKFSIEVFCRSGTYIRTLADDIGKDLGCGAHLSKLERNNSNGFDISLALNIEDLNPENIHEHLLELDFPLQHLEKLVLPEEEEYRYLNGQKLVKKDLSNGIKLVTSKSNKILGIADLTDNILIPEVNIRS